ncbi:KAP family P-loop NTPase fold protein [Uliginosibacterium sediminicola]|uniref:P-loop NTPase fold protein n=1 Tax=Uliginosibacterium sediminicola TaxID=2024550 RepID=A0ABU9YT86_9RHOO
MWHDNETTVDYLNFGVVADACAKLLQQARGEPISIGVSGGWGAGKSSLVRMVAARLSDAISHSDNTYVVVTFNPWLYQDFETSRNALLQLVGDEVLRRAANDETLLKKAKRLLQRINLLRLVQLGGEAAATIATGVPVGVIGRAIVQCGNILKSGAGGADDPDDQDEGESQALLRSAEPVSLPSEIQAFRDALEELLEELKITLVVFVDDLDRCLPRTAISTLESIRLLLFLKRSAFVIAADNEFIRGAVRVHFEGTGITGDVATNYFDKLIQVPLHVPRLGVNEAKGYLAMLLLQREHVEGRVDKITFEHALSALPERLKTSWRGDAITQDFLHSLAGLGNAPALDLMDLAGELAPLLAQSSAVNANPRLMKRFLNTVFLRAALAEPQGIKLDVRALAKWHLLERCDEPLANALAALVTSAADGRVDALRVAEEAARADGALTEPFKETAFTKEWLQLHPALGEEDLRPLLHLSRDSATRDFGSDEMSEEGRALRDALVVATGANAPLTSAIQAAGAHQAGKAMARAWQLRAAKRTWRQAEDVVTLVEPCKVYAELSASATALLAQAPIPAIGPGIIPYLYEQNWARPIVDKWAEQPDLSVTSKKAIQGKQKGGR